MKVIRIAIAVAAVLLLSGCSGVSSADHTNNYETVKESTTPSESSPISTDIATEDANISDSAEQKTDMNERESSSENTSKADKVPQETDDLEEIKLFVTIGNQDFTVTLDENNTTDALKELLKDGPLTVECSNYGGFEKVCRLGETLPHDDAQITTDAGDVMLYSGNQIVIFYSSNSWAYTRIGHVDEEYLEKLEEVLGGPETEITFSLK